MSPCHCPLKAAAKEAPSLPAVIAKDISLTFQELDALADEFQFSPRQIITTVDPLSPKLIALFFAAWRCNACLCPLNTKLPPSQIQTNIDRIHSHSGNITTPSLLLFTSGSTGTPKIAVLSLKSLLANAENSIPLSPSDRWLLSLPLYHVGGIGIMLRCVLAKAAIVLDKNHPDITHVSAVPTHLYRESPVYKNLKCVLLGGAPIHSIPPSLPIYATYGLTEMGSMVLARKNPPLIDGRIYLGNPLPKRELKLASDGEIWVRGETLFDGYLGFDKISGWFPTGDIGTVHPKEGIAIIGRKDWQFICGGENIQPEEIEQHLLNIPEIIEAVVIPVFDAEYGMRPVAIIKTHTPHISLHTIQAALTDHLPKYKIPFRLHILNEIPKNGLKINRKFLLGNLDLICT